MRQSRWQFCWNLYTIGFVNFVDQEIEFRCIQMLVSFSLKLNRETRLQKWNIAFSIQTKVRSGARIIPHANSCCVYERQSPFAGCVQSNLISRLRIQKRDLEYYRWRSWYNRSCSLCVLFNWQNQPISGDTEIESWNRLTKVNVLDDFKGIKATKLKRYDKLKFWSFFRICHHELNILKFKNRQLASQCMNNWIWAFKSSIVMF